MVPAGGEIVTPISPSTATPRSRSSSPTELGTSSSSSDPSTETTPLYSFHNSGNEADHQHLRHHGRGNSEERVPLRSPEAPAATPPARDGLDSAERDDVEAQTPGNDNDNSPSASDADPDATGSLNNGGMSSDAEESFAQLTRRIRCLFAVLTWPILPVAAILLYSVAWFLFTALLTFTDDSNKGKNTNADDSNCQAMRWYAVATLGGVLYTPYHRKIRQRIVARLSIVSNSSNTEGVATETMRARLARRYDQLFNTLILLYVYVGITMSSSCAHSAADSSTPSQPDSTSNGNSSNGSSDSVCSDSCTYLASAMVSYIWSVELLVASLLFPLLSLPCLYLYFWRQASVLWAERMLNGNGGEDWANSPFGTQGPSVSATAVLKLMEVGKSSRLGHFMS
jgi:hypothetical protein